jgi:hypothetical protein
MIIMEFIQVYKYKRHITKSINKDINQMFCIHFVAKLMKRRDEIVYILLKKIFLIQRYGNTITIIKYYNFQKQGYKIITIE